MSSLLAAALLAASAPAPAADLDRQCHALMAQLAADPDPAVRAAGTTAAQFFLGRIDAADPGFDPATVRPVEGADRPSLLARCGAMLEGRAGAFRKAGESLRRARPQA